MAQQFEALQPVVLPRQGEHDTDGHNDRLAKAQDAINQNLQIIYDIVLKAAKQKGG